MRGRRRRIIAASLLGLSAGGGWSSFSTASEAGFGYTPPFVVERSSAGAFRHKFNPEDNKPIPSAIRYVGPGGDDTTGDGLTMATRWATPSKGLTWAKGLPNSAASKPCLRVVVSDYWDAAGWNSNSIARDLVIEPIDSNGDVIPPTDGRYSRLKQIACWYTVTLPAFQATADPNVFVVTYGVEKPAEAAFDRKFVNEFGRPQGLWHVPPQAIANVANPIAELNQMHATWGVGAIFVDRTNFKVWVRLQDGRAPDGLFVVARDMTGSGTNSGMLTISGRSTTAPAAPAVTTFHGRNLDFFGGGPSFFSNATTGNGQTIVATLSDSYVGGDTRGNAFDVITRGLTFFYRCVAAHCYRDGFAYSVDDLDTQTAPIAGQTYFRQTACELDCIAKYIGMNAVTNTSTNGSTSHRDIDLLRINCSYAHVSNWIICDIQTANTLMLGGSIGPSTRISAAVAGFLPTVVMDPRCAIAGTSGYEANPQGESNNSFARFRGVTFVGPLSYAFGFYKGGTVLHKDCVFNGIPLYDPASVGTISTY